MPTTPGWYPDPTGLPFQRYWDGNAWTEHTDRVPSADAGATGAFATAKLPNVDYRPGKWYQRKGIVIGGSVLAALIVLGAIGAAIGPSPKNAGGAGGQISTPASTPTTALTTEPAPSTSDPTSSTASQRVQPAPTRSSRTKIRSSPADDGSWTMPNEVGQILQDAQDDLQRVSGDPAFFSHSHDLLSDRYQILDRDWKVCTQNVARDTRVSAVEHIDFGVVKLDESCP